jgi:hypothetical protein
MGASREWLVVKIRFGRDHKNYGDEFTGTCDVLNLQDGGCLIVGLLSLGFNIAARDDILDECVALGCAYAKAKIGRIWWRYDLTAKPYKRVRA